MTDPGPDDQPDQPEVLVSVDDGVASIILNRPARKNAITGPMMDRLAEAFQEAAVRDDVGAVLFHGADGGFCSGLDLGEYNADPPPAWLSTSLDSLVAAHRAIYACPVPVVGALERFAINGADHAPFRSLGSPRHSASRHTTWGQSRCTVHRR